MSNTQNSTKQSDSSCSESKTNSNSSNDNDFDTQKKIYATMTDDEISKCRKELSYEMKNVTKQMNKPDKINKKVIMSRIKFILSSLKYLDDLENNYA
jgi:hypothetical protein